MIVEKLSDNKMLVDVINKLHSEPWPMRSSQVHNEIGSSTVTNVLSGRYKENDFIIKSDMEIDKNVKL